MNPISKLIKTNHLRLCGLMAALVFITLLSACRDNNNPEQNTADSALIHAQFSPETYHKKHRISAFVEAVDQARLAFQVSGRISEQKVEIGQQVQKDQPLLTVYNPALAPAIDRIESQLAANRADLAQTQAELERNRSLSAIQAVSQNQLDRLDSAVKQLKSQQAALQAELQAAQNNFKETTLSAPFAGEVADILVKPGNLVEAGRPVVELSGANLYEAPFHVSHELLAHLQLNQILTAHKGANSFEVKVKEISRSANPASQLFKVVVTLPVDRQLLTGEKIAVTIPEPIAAIYQLPVSAVIDDGINEPYVYHLDNNQLKHQPVEVVDFYNNHIWVRINRPNDEVMTIVTTGQSSLTPPQQSDPS